ncbi:MAG: helix-turn-helix transcriptional regulator [Oscillospiraceae bacterium]|nr:helix-turn-helix transcriptional regulator [Oscillospiraceae bacterium]
MPKEFELVTHSHLQHVTAFLVRLQERVTHIHRELELGLVLDGAITLRTQQQTSVISKGDIYLVNRMEPHEFASEGNGALLIAIQFSTKLTQGFQAPGSHYRYRGEPNLRQALEENREAYRLLCDTCVELAYSFLRQQPNDEFHCFSLSASLMDQLHRALPWNLLDSEDYSVIKQRANRIMAITDYIDQNFQRKLLLGEIARREGLSLTYLSHFFKEALGMSFQEYLNQKRFEYACRLLFTTDRRILDISLSSGFSDVRYFNQAFLEQYGCTPKEYRKGGKLPASQFRQLEQNSQYIFSAQEALRMLEPMHREIHRKSTLYP